MSVIASTLQAYEPLKQRNCKVEVLFRPSVPDNQYYWQVFDSDSQIIQFLTAAQTPMINFEDQIKGSSIEGMDITKINFPSGEEFQKA